MRLNKILSIAAVGTLMAAASLPAQAQGSFSIGFGKFGKHSSFGVGLTVPLHSHRHVVTRRWVPGHYETRYEQVWVPGKTTEVWVEPVYKTIRDPHGHKHRVLVRAGYWQTVQLPGCYETRAVQVWVPGYYV